MKDYDEVYMLIALLLFVRLIVHHLIILCEVLNEAATRVDYRVLHRHHQEVIRSRCFQLQ